MVAYLVDKLAEKRVASKVAQMVEMWVALKVVAMDASTADMTVVY